MNTKKIEFLNKRAKEVRKNIIQMSTRAKSAHTGGALSCVEILVSLYFDVMRVYPKDPYNDKRDRLIFSKAHDAKALYAVLAERGFFDKKILEGYELDGGRLPGHSTRKCVPGVEVSAGSLGHGLSMATGMAYAGKIDDKTCKFIDSNQHLVGKKLGNVEIISSDKIPFYKEPIIISSFRFKDEIYAYIKRKKITNKIITF